MPEGKKQAMTVVDNGPNELFLDTAKFEQAQRACKLLASSTLIPDSFRNNPGNCFIALNLSSRLGIDPFMVLQNMYVVHGKPGIQAQLVIAMINAKGPFDGPIEFSYTGQGKTRKCTASATIADSGRKVETSVDWAMVEAEGWNKDKQTKSGYTQKSKWNTMPDQMFAYRAAAFFARLYCPEVIMGLSTVDELVDIDTNSKPQKEQTKVEAMLAHLEQLPAPEPKEESKQEQKQERKKPNNKKKEQKEKKAEHPAVKKARQIFLQDNTESDNKLELLMRRAQKDGISIEAINKWLKDIGIDKFNKDTQTGERLAEFGARIEDFRDAF